MAAACARGCSPTGPQYADATAGVGSGGRGQCAGPAGETGGDAQQRGDWPGRVPGEEGEGPAECIERHGPTGGAV